MEPSPTPANALGDVPIDEMRTHLHRMADWCVRYRETIEERPISPSVLPGQITARIDAAPPAAGVPLDTIMRELDSIVMPGIVHWSHPAFLGYFGSTSNGPALLGEIAAAALNVSAMTWRTSPAATELESVVVNWIRLMVGLPGEYTGIVYDTASVSLLHALAAAREAAGTAIRERGLAGRSDLPTFRVYASDQAHSSLEKAMIVLGLGEANVRRVASDDQFRMDVHALREAMDEDARAGFRLLAVVATVGTTSSTSVDPVGAIAALCRQRGVWLHVDAAYGGAMGLLPEGGWAMEGVHLADSVVVNPHKWLCVPLDFSALFTRHPQLLRRVFALTPDYLIGDAGAGDGAAIDYMDYGLQLGRRFRALKAWMVIRAFGQDGLAARVREHRRLARCWADWVAAEPQFELAAPVPMAVVCFRFAPDGLSDDHRDALNIAIVEAVNASGDVFLTHTRLRGRAVMRVGIGNIATTESHLAHAWARVRSAAKHEAR